MKQVNKNICLEADLDSVVNKGILESLPKHLTKYLFGRYIDVVKNKLSNILVPKNFCGDAEHYLFQKGVAYSPDEVDAYSLAIYADFIANIDQLISYSEDTNEIQISALLWALEHGDFHKPALHIFSDELKELARSAEDAIESIRN